MLETRQMQLVQKTNALVEKPVSKEAIYWLL